MVSTASVNQDLKIVLWIAIALGVLEIIIMYKKFDFLNVIINNNLDVNYCYTVINIFVGLF